MNPITLTLELPPSSNRYWRYVVVRSGRHMVPRVLVSQSARVYKAGVREYALRAHIEPLEGPLCVAIDIYCARKVGDLDGFLKVLLDAMQGACYENDKQIVQITARRFDDKDDPRAEITITKAL